MAKSSKRVGAVGHFWLVNEQCFTAERVLGPLERKKEMERFVRGCSWMWLVRFTPASPRSRWDEERGPRRIEKCGWLKISKSRVAFR